MAVEPSFYTPFKEQEAANNVEPLPVGILEELDEVQLRRKARRTLIDTVNEFIKEANRERIRRGVAPRKLLNRNCINKAVAIARNPGPFIHFDRGALDGLLIMAGFEPKKRKR